jgi:hypothetical protein
MWIVFLSNIISDGRTLSNYWDFENYRDIEPVHCTYVITADIRDMMSNSTRHDLTTEIIPSPAAEMFVDSVQPVDYDVALV